MAASGPGQWRRVILETSRAGVMAGALLGAGTAFAQDARFVLAFGAEANAPLPHAYSYGQPPAGEKTLVMRVPLVDPALKPILTDVELTLDLEGNVVRRVHAERAYLSLDECTAAKATIDGKLAPLMPAPYTGSEAWWQYQSADGKSLGGALCRTERYLPYPVLVFDLSAVP